MDLASCVQAVIDMLVAEGVVRKPEQRAAVK